MSTQPAKTIFVLKVNTLRGEEQTEGVKNYGGIYPFAYMSKEAAIAKATKLCDLDYSKFSRAVRSFEIVDVKVGEKSWKALVAAKTATPDQDVPLYLITVNAAGQPAVENLKLYGGVYPWAYASEDAAMDKIDKLDDADTSCDREFHAWAITGVSGLKDFIPARTAAPAPAPAPRPTAQASACACGGSCRPFTAAVSGSTTDGARLTGVVAGFIEEGGE